MNKIKLWTDKMDDLVKTKDWDKTEKKIYDDNKEEIDSITKK